MAPPRFRYKTRMKTLPAVMLVLCTMAVRAEVLPTDDGYRGIWYFNQPSKDEYKYKYSGGFATYPQQHAPLAIYSARARKTFFVYGGTTARAPDDRQELLHMISYFDHETGTVPRPRVLLNKHTDDAHDNPAMSIDDAGRIWIFSSAHGTSRPSFISRSVRPYDITEFERVCTTNFSYVNPWWIEGRGFLFLHTRYQSGQRGLRVMTSRDGETWGPAEKFAHIEMGDYQISWKNGARVATAFDHHPAPVGLNARANIYYLETADFGATWRTAAGEAVALPLTNATNPALIYDSRAEKKLVYLKDVNFDAQGRPVILFLTSKGYESGPKNGPREWTTARWTGREWQFRKMTESGNNYDHGSLYTEADGAWRVIAPTEPGPQAGNPGGEMAMWLTRDEGATWTKIRQLTKNSERNHTYARRPLDADPAFYAFWADGDGRKPSISMIYFTDREGSHVWRLPRKMDGDSAKPETIE